MRKHHTDMHSVQLNAGHLSVAIQTPSEDEGGEDLQTVVSAAHVELDWIMDQHSTIDGKMVGLEAENSIFDGGR